jgi:hypothetical protein
MVKEPKYAEGSEALKRFKQGMEELFKVSKNAVAAKKE